jgi:hypothetical protein
MAQKNLSHPQGQATGQATDPCKDYIADLDAIFQFVSFIRVTTGHAHRDAREAVVRLLAGTDKRKQQTPPDTAEQPTPTVPVTGISITKDELDELQELAVAMAGFTDLLEHNDDTKEYAALARLIDHKLWNFQEQIYDRLPDEVRWPGIDDEDESDPEGGAQ